MKNQVYVDFSLMAGYILTYLFGLFKDEKLMSAINRSDNWGELKIGIGIINKI